PTPLPCVPHPPPRTREGRHHPAPKTAKRALSFSGGGALSRSGRGAVARAGEGRGGGGRREGAGFGLRDSARPPAHPGGGKPLPYFGLAAIGAASSPFDV